MNLVFDSGSFYALLPVVMAAALLIFFLAPPPLYIFSFLNSFLFFFGFPDYLSLKIPLCVYVCAVERKRESARLERLNLADLSNTSVWILGIVGRRPNRNVRLDAVGHVAQSSNHQMIHDNKKWSNQYMFLTWNNATLFNIIIILFFFFFFFFFKFVIF